MTGYLLVAGLPDTLRTSSYEALDGSLAPADVIARYLDPRTVSLTTLVNQVIFFALLTAILTFAVWRSRRLMRRQVAADRQRNALSRYFSPNLVAELAEQGAALPPPTVQPAAVLFADMVGFTGPSERLSPEALVGLLSEFHDRPARVAFANGGTVDKFIGDAIMVHFGTPHPAADDPVRALRAAGAMVEEMELWNAERSASAQEPVAIGIGVHFGEVLCGNIGASDRLEYTVLGDTVNVAARLERLTRELSVALVVSDALVVAVREAGADPAAFLASLEPSSAQHVRGRCEPVAVWFMPSPGRAICREKDDVDADDAEPALHRRLSLGAKAC
ncbi:adenylate/guanylate cyclase domain-containing protein [Acuticoccus sediminis]|uniref:adenylate/guanylate cyclase domain-containing protein n=1 Tax=Acuticoccus sediminis TaxID=2184697 RepID=UPI001CFE6016|nr:adenylate/guanylate cyclase domain-containing protein [Acuticoccus sediminis]